MRIDDSILLATLTHYYEQLERRLAIATNPRHPQVKLHLARAALDLFLATCDAELAAELAPRRAALQQALVDQRQAIDDAIFELGRRLDRPVFAGPVNLIYDPLRRINALVVAPAGPVLEYAVGVCEQFMPESRVVEAESSGWSELTGRNAVLYGAPTTPVLRDVLAEAGWQVEATHITLGARRIEGEQLGLIACRTRPDDPTLADVVYTAADERVVLGINGLHHGPSDFVIGRLTKVGRYQIVLRGNFARGPAGELLTTIAA